MTNAAVCASRPLSMGCASGVLRYSRATMPSARPAWSTFACKRECEKGAPTCERASSLREGPNLRRLPADALAKDLASGALVGLTRSSLRVESRLSHRRRPPSEDCDPGFIADDVQVQVPMTPVTHFACVTCREPIADDVTDQLAAALVQQEAFLSELASYLPGGGGAEQASRLILEHKFDVTRVEAALFDLVVAASALGMDHTRRNELYREARAPVRALREQMDAAEEGSGRPEGRSRPEQRAERRALQEKLRSAMKDAGRHLFATMNLQSTMGVEIGNSGRVEVDFHGLRECQVGFQTCASYCSAVTLPLCSYTACSPSAAY